MSDSIEEMRAVRDTLRDLNAIPVTSGIDELKQKAIEAINARFGQAEQDEAMMFCDIVIEAVQLARRVLRAIDPPGLPAQ